MAVVIYRAKTQSFTIDEAFAFNLYIDQPIKEFFTNYDPANHFLHTLLTKLVRYALGTSELVLRLVSLVGALLYFVVARRLCLMAAGAGWTHVIGLSALCLNPLVLDFMVAARGYGLAVALLLWAVYYSLRWLAEGGEETFVWRAGFAAGLSIAAHLTMIVPAAALGITLLWAGFYRDRRTIWTVVDRFAAPAVVLPFLLAILPLSRANAGSFYFGSNSLTEAAGSVWDQSYRYFAQATLLSLSRDVALPALFALLTGASFAVMVARTRRNSGDFASNVFVFTGMPLALSVAALAGLNHFLGVPYPLGRSGLYLFPLFVLAFLSASALLAQGGLPARLAGGLGNILLMTSALLFICQFNPNYFEEWRFDASTNRLIDVISADRRTTPADRFSVASSSIYKQSLMYYRKRRKLHYMSPQIKDLDAGADYFVLAPQDLATARNLGLRVLSEDPFTGAIVARRS